MKQKLLNVLTSMFFLLAFVSGFGSKASAQEVEKLIIYENFGGTDAGSSVSGIQPEMWPAVHSDSGKYCGWYSTMQKLDNKNSTVLVPQFYSNGFFSIDSVEKNRTGGLNGLNITVDDLTKAWSYNVPLRNGYKLPGTNASTVGFKMFGAAALPELMSWISYASYTPEYLKNQTDEKGYIYFGKNVGTERPILSIPSSDIEYLANVSKLELLVSGSRLGQNNTIEVRIEELTEEGETVGVDTFTYSATIEPRMVTIPVNKSFVRIYIQAWGSANNANVTDLALKNSNTEVDTWAPYNYNAVESTKPDGSHNAGQTTNPGMQLHMIKVYALMQGTYSITTDNALVSGTTTGITYGQTVQLTAQATNGSGKKFMGWTISGKPDLSEVVNPVKVMVTSNMTVMPVYVGDEVEVPVVNENFTNWAQHGAVLPDKNNQLDYSNGDPMSKGAWNGTVKVPLRYGFTSNGEDSVDITLKQCNVIPQYGLRVYNYPGWEKYTGYVAFMGPNTDKGFVKVDSLVGITKAEVDVSSYDLPNPDRACAFLINDSLYRNKMLQTLGAQTVLLTNDPGNPFSLQIGPGNQARCEYLTPEAANADIFTGMSAAAAAMHNLKLYAKVIVPDKNLYMLTVPKSTNGGHITGINPSAGNSSNEFFDGTKVTIGAISDLGFGFDGWVDENGASLGNDNPITVTMDANKTVKPVFAQNPSYIKLVANADGEVTTNVAPQSVSNDTMTFLAGVAVNLTATPRFGYKFTNWVLNGKDSIPSGSAAKSSTLKISAANMVKDAYQTISVVYDSITTRKAVFAISDTTMGKITFDHTPENITYKHDTLQANFPEFETIQVTGAPQYGYSFTKWTKGLSVGNSDTTSNPISLTFTADRTLEANWSALKRYKLIINQGVNGTIAITDIHKDGTLEQDSLWPANYDVELTATPTDGYVLASLGSDVTANYKSETVVTVNMDQDTVIVTPEFVQRQTGVVLAVNEIFQDPTRWPEPEGTVSNVPGAIDFLGLDANWDPKTYNNNLEGLLKILAPYRVWGSESNDHSDGPSGTKDPRTTLVLKYQKDLYSTKLRIGTSNDSVTLKVVNYAPCNNCLIAKAVKDEGISNHYLGHVTPGFVALKKLSNTTRTTADSAAFYAKDSVGMMVVEGLAYVEKVEVGFVSNGTQVAPGVFYIDDQSVQLFNDKNEFGAMYSDLWPIGQVSRPDYTPYQNKYGWGSSQEGMIMDQNMYVAEEDIPETRILITSGFKKTGTTYSYSDIYIHDLKIWGSPVKSTGIKDLFSGNHSKDDSFCKFSILGSTGMLKVDTEEPIKALVIYNINGSAIKVIQNLHTNEINVSSLRPGYYAAHAYGISGKQYKGTFVKID